jgi:hypothetical protein
LVAEECVHDDQQCIMIRWLDNGHRNHQPLFIHVEHGPESLKSLAAFVEYLRRVPPDELAAPSGNDVSN